MNLPDYLASHPDCAPAIPVIVLDDPAQAVPLARACAAGGVRVLEITLRTAAGLESIRRVAAEVPEVLVGAGTVTSVRDMADVRAAGARFAFSPGFDESLVQAAADQQIEFIPGVMTASEVMRAQNAGCSFMKLFPAAQAGGIGMLKALGGPFPSVRFCPTGGVDAKTAADYLTQPNVLAVGGSWITPAAAVRGGDWATITRLAGEALTLRRSKETKQ